MGMERHAERPARPASLEGRVRYRAPASRSPPSGSPRLTKPVPCSDHCRMSASSLQFTISPAPLAAGERALGLLLLLRP